MGSILDEKRIGPAHDGLRCDAPRGRQRTDAAAVIAVIDAGGDLIAFKREDHTGIRRYDIAYGKAFAALVMNRLVPLMT